ncbi:MAG: preprotein translocase subunit SecG [Clostridiales bacterium]|jgi:preprotein translocase subunit SecG|nr:preprotein translocase subunit SecG [Clostridiales bacterium]
MTSVQIIFTILMLIASLALIVSVLLQKGDAEGISALTGGGSSNSFFGKNKSKTIEGKLALLTKASATAFVVLGLILIFV